MQHTQYLTRRISRKDRGGKLDENINTTASNTQEKYISETK